MYRESSMTTTAIMVVVWAANLAIAAVAIVLLAAIARGAGATWMPGISFWQAVVLRMLFKALSGDMLKVSPRDYSHLNSLIAAM